MCAVCACVRKLTTAKHVTGEKSVISTEKSKTATLNWLAVQTVLIVTIDYLTGYS